MKKNLKINISGIGVDIVDLNRIHIDNEHFINRILSDEEIAVFYSLSSDRRKVEFLGGRYAAKEAFLKACHKGLGEIPFKDIIILNKESGAPYLNCDHAHISISHENNYAIAFVVIE
jgi:holo-[acyl-carrier protein] synthase